MADVLSQLWPPKLICMVHFVSFVSGVDCGKNPQWRIEIRGALGLWVIHCSGSCYSLIMLQSVLIVNSIDLDR